MAIERIRVGVVGAGGNTRGKHLPGLQAIEGVSIVSVCNRTLASGRKVADQFGIPRVCSHWTEVVDDPEVDAVVIGTWPYLHCPVTCAALHAGKHVLVEARMAMNAAEAHEMLETSRLYPELVAQVVPSPFTFEFDATVRDLVAEGYLGELYAIDLRGLTGGFADRSSPMNWRQDIDLSGLNTMGMGIWYEALARWVGHAKRVTARRQVCVKQRPHPEGGLAAIRVPDHLDVIADMDCGAQAHLRFSSVMGLARDTAAIWLYGSAGTLFADLSAKKLMGGRQGDSALAEIPIPPAKKGAWRVEAEFVNAIRGLEPVRLTSFVEGVKYMEFTEAVARSADRGETVSLPLFD